MASAGIPGVTDGAVRYVQNRLESDLSDDEARQTFAKKIEESVGATLTQWNFFFHNFAISRKTKAGGGGSGKTASGAEMAGGETLSFVPQTYTMKTDGRIAAVKVYSIQKRYTPEKHYVMILEVSRENEKVPAYLFRTYQQFCELDSKLSLLNSSSNLR